LGKNPGPIERTVPQKDIQYPAVPAGIPSDLLDRRPDIRQAEQALHAAQARIWVAKAQYFPSIQLTGAYGVASTDLNNLFTGPANTWNFLVPITAPIFTAGNIAGQVKTAEAMQKEALAAYQKTIQQAFADVENSLINNQKSREQADALAKQVVALTNYYLLARMQYENGYTDYTTVMDAERQLFSCELTYVQTRFTQGVALINLYTSLGGGWKDAEAVENADKKQAKK
ncbi:MAG: TolC family protein, partial [Syntrophales bacterium LBB04]|nr:TolC family protein [Syntrophales bacterium LBB04]